MKKLIKNSIGTLGVLALSLALGLVGPFAALAAGPSAVNLGTAGNFVILAKTGVTTTGVTAITGFGLILDKSGTFSTSNLVTGKIFAANYTAPTPSMLTTAIGDMQTAYTNAAGRTNPTATELGAGNIGGLTLKPGLYKWGTSVTIPTNVTLSGGKNDIWIFQVAGTLNISSGKQIILKGGAQAKNIFWQVAGVANLGSGSVFNGNILDKTAVTMQSGAVLNGKALAQTNVTLIANKIK